MSISSVTQSRQPLSTLLPNNVPRINILNQQSAYKSVWLRWLPWNDQSSRLQSICLTITTSTGVVSAARHRHHVSSESTGMIVRLNEDSPPTPTPRPGSVEGGLWLSSGIPGQQTHPYWKVTVVCGLICQRPGYNLTLRDRQDQLSWLYWL